MECDSKDYSWKWVTADELLSHGACELLYAYFVPLGTTIDTVLYDGENTSGVPIVTLAAPTEGGHAFSPKKPVYCRRGLYVDVGTSVIGIFVQWRELGHKEG